jgi:hypothetical protein
MLPLSTTSRTQLSESSRRHTSTFRWFASNRELLVTGTLPKRNPSYEGSVHRRPMVKTRSAADRRCLRVKVGREFGRGWRGVSRLRGHRAGERDLDDERPRRRGSVLALAIDVRAMSYCQDGDRSRRLIDAVDDAIRAATGRPASLVLKAQRLAYALRVGGDDRQQLKYCRRVLLRQASDIAAGRTGGDQPPRPVVHAARSLARLARRSACISSSVAVSPTAAAASPSRICSRSVGSDRIASVSSSPSRSSVLMRTAAAFPFRVSTMRSCSSSTRSTISERCALTDERGRTSGMTVILVRSAVDGKRHT